MVMLVNQKKNKGKETQTYLKSKKGIPMLMRILELRTNIRINTRNWQ